MMMRSAYTAFGGAVEKTTQDVLNDACRSLEDVYTDVFGVEPGQVVLKPPAELVLKETSSIVSELTDEMAPALCNENAEILKEFLGTQSDTLLALADTAAADPAEHSENSTEKAEALNQTRQLIDSLAA